MCKYCSDNQEPLIEGRLGNEILGIRFDACIWSDFKELRVIFGDFHGNEYGSEWDGKIKIKYCPVCGRKLTESEEQK